MDRLRCRIEHLSVRPDLIRGTTKRKRKIPSKDMPGRLSLTFLLV